MAKVTKGDPPVPASSRPVDEKLGRGIDFCQVCRLVPGYLKTVLADTVHFRALRMVPGKPDGRSDQRLLHSSARLEVQIRSESRRIFAADRQIPYSLLPDENVVTSQRSCLKVSDKWIAR